MEPCNLLDLKLSKKDYKRWKARAEKHLCIVREQEEPPLTCEAIYTPPETPAAPTAPPSSWLWDYNTDSPTKLAKVMWGFVMIWACVQVFVGLGLCMKAMPDSILFHPVSHAIMDGTVTGIVLLVVADIVSVALTTA